MALQRRFLSGLSILVTFIVPLLDLDYQLFKEASTDYLHQEKSAVHTLQIRG